MRNGEGRDEGRHRADQGEGRPLPGFRGALRARAEGRLDESIHQLGRSPSGRENRERGPAAQRLAARLVFREDVDRPVAEIERVGDPADVDDGRQAESRPDDVAFTRDDHERRADARNERIPARKNRLAIEAERRPHDQRDPG